MSWPTNITEDPRYGQEIYGRMHYSLMQIKTTINYHLISMKRAARKEGRKGCWQRPEELESLYTARGNGNWYSHQGKQYGGSAQIKNRIIT